MPPDIPPDDEPVLVPPPLALLPELPLAVEAAPVFGDVLLVPFVELLLLFAGLPLIEGAPTSLPGLDCRSWKELHYCHYRWLNWSH